MLAGVTAISRRPSNMGAEGETDQRSLIKTMSPILYDETFVFGHIQARPDSDFANVLKIFIGLPVQMLFRESEGWTVIVPETVAQEIQLKSTYPCKKITLEVHSSLDAVGFMAAITTRLTELSCGVNPVSGYFHDHLFVPVGREKAVLEALKNMATEQ